MRPKNLVNGIEITTDETAREIDTEEWLNFSQHLIAWQIISLIVFN